MKQKILIVLGLFAVLAAFALFADLGYTTGFVVQEHRDIYGRTVVNECPSVGKGFGFKCADFAGKKPVQPVAYDYAGKKPVDPRQGGIEIDPTEGKRPLRVVGYDSRYAGLDADP